MSRVLDERLLELSALFEISRSLTASLSIRSVLENILRIPMGHMLISRGMVMLNRGEDDIYVLEELKGLPRNLLGKILKIDTMIPRSMLIEEDDESRDWLDFFKKYNIELLIPLVSGQGNVGIIGFGNKIGNKSYTEAEIEFLDSLSNIAATSVANSLNVEEIQAVNRALDRKIQQLNTIFDISRELNMTLDSEKIGSLLIFAVMGELMVNKCTVYVRHDDEMGVLVSKGGGAVPGNSEQLCGLTEPIVLEHIEQFRRFRDAGFAVLVPMRVQDVIQGVLAVGGKITGAGFTDADLEFLKTLGNQAMTSIENARLFEETLEKQKMEEELNLARSMQQALLPERLPELPGYEIAAINLSSRQVGGDLYDVIAISEHVWGIAIADVSGKGAGAALLMSNLQASLRALAGGDLTMAEMVSRINVLIHQNTPIDKFITFFYGELNTETGEFTYCNAGHNPPYRISGKGAVEELMAGGLILGMMPDVRFETGSVTLKAGDRIVMFTDGISEAMNSDEEEFGEENIWKIAANNPSCGARELLDRIVAAVQAYVGNAPQSDDITMVILKALH
ncbi:SpoIIE family protein phosphatase [bacterium]|nr:SpoIIE family protein phosphatase [bacterium]